MNSGMNTLTYSIYSRTSYSVQVGITRISVLGYGKYMHKLVFKAMHCAPRYMRPKSLYVSIYYISCACEQMFFSTLSVDLGRL